MLTYGAPGDHTDRAARLVASTGPPLAGQGMSVASTCQPPDLPAADTLYRPRSPPLLGSHVLLATAGHWLDATAVPVHHPWNGQHSMPMGRLGELRPRKHKTQAVTLTRPPALQRISLAAVTCVVLIAAAIRVAPLSSESLDIDELFSMAVASKSLPEALDVIQRDVVHPPAYYLAIRPAIAALGQTALGVRLLSLVAGVGLVLLTILWTRSLVGHWCPGLLAGTLVAVSSLQTYYSQQGRSYALYSLLVMVLAAGLARAIESERRRDWVVFACASAVATLTHYVALVFAAATLPAVLLATTRRREIKRWTISVLFSGAALALWLLSVYPHYAAKGGLRPNLGWVGIPAWYELARVFAQFNGLPALRHGTTLSLSVMAALCLIALWKLARARRGLDDAPRPVLALIAGLVVMPPVVLFLTTRPPLSLTIWGERHLLPAQAFLVMLTSITLWQSTRRRRRMLVLGAALLIGLQMSAAPSILDGPRRVPYAEVAVRLAANHASTPAYATWAGIAEPVNFYAGMERVCIIDDQSVLPEGTMWLLYRPGVAAEAARLRGLLAAGWRVATDPSHFGREWGTTAVLLVREAAWQSRTNRPGGEPTQMGGCP